MRLIDADALKPNIDKFIGYLDEDMITRIKIVIDNAPTVLHDNYSMGYQDGVKKVLSERSQDDKNLENYCTIKFNEIKAIINNWAVDDDEHELLEQIADIIRTAPECHATISEFEWKRRLSNG